MGSIISAPIGMAATCCGSLLGSCCASMTCKACSCACVLPKQVTSVAYLGTLAIFTFFAMMLRFSDNDIVIGGSYNATQASDITDAISKALDAGGISKAWNSKFWCASKHPHGWVICCEDVCGGVFAVYRFSFTLCLMFAFLALCTIGTTRFGAKAHRGFWFLKAFTAIALLISTIFIKNDAMEAYREVARYLSFAFLLLQILLLIDFGYFWNVTWL
jgi:hypothetical protein